jgi:hypothetical protein
VELRKLAKDSESGKTGCQIMYLAADGMLVVQGDEVDARTRANLENLLPGEAAVRIKPEIVIEALRRYGSTG